MKQVGIIFLLFLAFGQCMASEEGGNNREARVSALKRMNVKGSIVYRPREVKGVVTIFTDLDCTYCRKLHHEIKKLVELGIEVRYLAFPRRGVGSSTYTKMTSIWCAEDPKKTMTQAMEGEEIKTRHCEAPITQQLLLGHKLGVTGTPTLIFEDGSMWGGYLPAASLAKQAIKHNLKE